MDIHRIEDITINTVQKVLQATNISAYDKEAFLKLHHAHISGLLADKINSAAFRKVMNNRPLKIFRPLKNSYTKRGDRKILADVLGIEPSELDDYIGDVTEKIKENDYADLPKDEIDMIKTYIYRHGKQDDVLNYLDYELKDASDKLGILYRTLSYNTGGIADYYVRPIHHLTNKNIVRIYEIINNNLKESVNSGKVSREDKDRVAEYALVRIYEIQNNQKLKNAIKLKRELG